MNLNARNTTGGARLFAEIEDETAAAVFLDPQYRTNLDKLGYGNEGEGRGKRRADLPQMRDEMIRFFIEESVRVLRPSGHLFFWINKFLVVEATWRKWLPFSVEQPEGTLQSVDMITWRKSRPGMGRRSRYRSEFLIVLQKQPIRAAGCWTDHRIDDVWYEAADTTRHPHAKPLQLTQRLIRATTKKGDLVVDPCAGSYSVLDCCIETGRNFFGCDVVDLGEDE